MNKNAIARQLARLGKREARTLAALQQIHQERCELLTGLISEADLEPDVVALGIAPKDR
jgi:hypothetical protein